MIERSFFTYDLLSIFFSLTFSPNNSDSEVYPDITFKVQIAASTRKLETKSYNFKGLSDISREQINGIYKYYYGSTSNYNHFRNSMNKN